MILQQTEILAASNKYNFIIGNQILTNNPIYLIHSMVDIRLVEGVIIVLNEILGSVKFDWSSGYDLASLQNDIQYNQKDRILSSLAVLFIATYKSLQDQKLLNLLDFSTNLSKPTYIFPTRYEQNVYGESFSSRHNILYIEQSKMSNKRILKVKNPNIKNMMQTIINVEQLQ